MIIADPIAASRDAEARHALHKARCQTSEPAIAEGRVRLGATHPVRVDTDVAKRSAYDIAASEISDHVVEQAPDQKLQRHVVDALAALRIAVAVDREPAMDDAVPQRECGRDKPVPVGRSRRILSHRQGQLGEDRCFEFLNLLIAHRRVGHRRQPAGLWRIASGNVHWHPVKIVSNLIVLDGAAQPAIEELAHTYPPSSTADNARAAMPRKSHIGASQPVGSSSPKFRERLSLYAIPERDLTGWHRASRH